MQFESVATANVANLNAFPLQATNVVDAGTIDGHSVCHFFLWDIGKLPRENESVSDVQADRPAVTIGQQADSPFAAPALQVADRISERRPGRTGGQVLAGLSRMNLDDRPVRFWISIASIATDYQA